MIIISAAFCLIALGRSVSLLRAAVTDTRTYAYHRELPQRNFKNLVYKRHRKIKVLARNYDHPLNFHLVASSSKHVFVASSDGLLAVYPVDELMYSKGEPWRHTVKLPERPSHIAVNCDGELLAVLAYEKPILIYNVKDFWKQDASPTLSVSRGTSSDAFDMQWSPSMTDTLAIGFYDKITILHVGTDIGRTNETINNSNIRCFSWSPSGSSLVVGHCDGSLCVYSHDLTRRRCIPLLPPFDEAPYSLKAVHWMSNNQFAVMYYENFDSTGRENIGRETDITLIYAPEGELPPRAEYVGRLESSKDWSWYRLLEIKPWNVMLCWSTIKADIKLLPPDSDRGDSQAPVQLLSEFLREGNVHIVGVALDRSTVLRLSSQSHLHQPTDETVTLLHVLTETGELATYTVVKRPSTPRVDTESSRTTPCSEPAVMSDNQKSAARPEAVAGPSGVPRVRKRPRSSSSNSGNSSSSDSSSSSSTNNGARSRRNHRMKTPRAPCTSDLPPLTFHSVHGENIRVSRDGSEARRVESSSGGVAFSARPVRVNEKVFIRFVEISNSWLDVIGFGFTNHDPMTLLQILPKNACPDLTNKPGNWAKALDERFCKKDNILYYYVNSAGDVHFGVNGEEKGLFFSGVDTCSPLWALVDMYEKCIAVQFAHSRAPSQIRRPNQTSVKEERLISGMRKLPQLRYKCPLKPLSLHMTKGKNIQFINNRGVAARIEAEFCQGYVFTARPMRPGQTILVQILSTETGYADSLAIGLTTCDPATLRACDLPDDAEQLLNRPEYWVVRREAASGVRRGDELTVTLTLDGEVRVSRNESNPVKVIHVDHSVRLWAFVDIYGATQKVRMLSSLTVQTPPQQLRELAGSAQNINTSGETVLADSLRPQNGGQNANRQMTLASAHCTELLQSNQLCSASQNSCNEQPQIPNERDRDEPSTNTKSHSVIGERQLTGKECIICCDNPKDSALSECGHMCMCYNCAVRQWEGKGDGRCPICRTEIKNVIRAYIV